MSGPHFCNFCKNHGVLTRVSHIHRQNCPWRECVCPPCSRIRRRNEFRRSINRATTSTTTSSTEAGPSGLGTVSAAAILSTANAATVAGSATSAAAARAAKCKRIHDQQKNEEMNKFVNNFMASLTEQEKKLPFLTNHARALKAFSEQKNSSFPGQSTTVRQPSNTMVVLQLQEIFPHIPYTTLLQLYKDCGENSENVVTALTAADEGNSAAESTDFGGPLMSIDDCLNQQRLFSLFPQHGDIITDVFRSFSFNFVKTVDFLLSLADNNSSGAVLSFALQPHDLPVVSLGNGCDPLSASLSTSATTGSQRRLFRCPHCGHPLEGRPRL